MKQWKIVTDSSANIRSLDELTDEIAFELVPLMINIGNQVYMDDASLDLEAFNEDLQNTNEKTSSACPAPGVYAQAFSGAENIICFTITGSISGSYNSAQLGKELALEENPEANIYIYDTKTAGGEMGLLITKALELIRSGADFDEVVQQVTDYQSQTHTVFLLESVQNLVNNGRVNRLVGGMVGLLGIRLIGRRTDDGVINLAHKSRGSKRALNTLLAEMEAQGYAGGRLYINHNNNQAAVDQLVQLVRKKYPTMFYDVTPTGALCSYYAESQGIIVGFEIE